ncbi:hypothetical protein [Kitasatospora kifunensis]|uniref:PknH-like extracellular domain-containing protein n=1 Tax=Kitasatospora kifunensis TaxID=58351 RepID=A0A7W7R524_KITKI|nr:hypothetical protein [Kitasatospora kifunensis]MBB4925313.1 hypothetical protein [Kitasatospora kifunensis]
MTLRPVALLLLPALAVAGCATVRPDTAADQAQPARVLTAAELRAAAVGAAELGGGYTVRLLSAGQAAPPPGGAERQLADVPACQPVLDAIGPADPGAEPQAETDLTVAKAAGAQSAQSPGPRGADAKGADSSADLYIALLGYPAGRAGALQSTLDQVLAQCASFTSGVKPAAGAAKGTRTRQQLARVDTPTPEGADGATGFTLTSGPETGAATLVQRAAVVRVGTALAVFSTVGTTKEPAAAPDPAVLSAQTRKLRAAQR